MAKVETERLSGCGAKLQRRKEARLRVGDGEGVEEESGTKGWSAGVGVGLREGWMLMMSSSKRASSVEESIMIVQVK